MCTYEHRARRAHQAHAEGQHAARRDDAAGADLAKDEREGLEVRAWVLPTEAIAERECTHLHAITQQRTLDDTAVTDLRWQVGW